MSPAEILAAAETVANVLLMLVPHEDAKKLLDDAAQKRAQAIADAAEAAKFGHE